MRKYTPKKKQQNYAQQRATEKADVFLKAIDPRIKAVEYGSPSAAVTFVVPQDFDTDRLTGEGFNPSKITRTPCYEKWEAPWEIFEEAYQDQPIHSKEDFIRSLSGFSGATVRFEDDGRKVFIDSIEPGALPSNRNDPRITKELTDFVSIPKKEWLRAQRSLQKPGIE